MNFASVGLNCDFSGGFLPFKILHPPLGKALKVLTLMEFLKVDLNFNKSLPKLGSIFFLYQTLEVKNLIYHFVSLDTLLKIVKEKYVLTATCFVFPCTQSINGAHKDWICSLDFLPGRDCLISGCRGGILKLWQTSSCAIVGEMKAHTSPINSIATNSTHVFTASR